MWNIQHQICSYKVYKKTQLHINAIYYSVLQLNNITIPQCQKYEKWLGCVNVRSLFEWHSISVPMFSLGQVFVLPYITVAPPRYTVPNTHTKTFAQYGVC